MVVVHRSLRLPECREYSLLLQAMGVEHTLERGIFGWRVLVAEESATFAREQWRLYQLENRPRPAARPALAPRPGAALGGLAWLLVLSGVYLLQSGYTGGIDWTAAGDINGAAVRNGEWWRTLTALTLHADVAHLSVNIGVGAIFGTLLAREIGGGYAWALILFGGACGNWMNVILQRPTHLSIGASTAVFAALGLLGAYFWVARRTLRHNWASRASPLVGAIMLLAWLGTGTERTDVVAHLTGFIAGFVIGIALGRSPVRPGAVVSRQWLAGGAALIALAFAWMLALGNHPSRLPVY